MAAAEVFTSLTENPPHIIMDPKKNFHLFAYLNEDIKMTILSFLADAPFETMPDNYPTSSLTHKLPQVSQKFRRLASSDSYWKDALVRQTKKEPFLWKPALRKLRSHSEDEEGKEGSTQELVEDAFKINNYESYKKLYESVVTQHLRYKGPVFVMAGQGERNFIHQIIYLRVFTVFGLTLSIPFIEKKIQSVWGNHMNCIFSNRGIVC